MLPDLGLVAGPAPELVLELVHQEGQVVDWGHQRGQVPLEGGEHEQLVSQDLVAANQNVEPALDVLDEPVHGEARGLAQLGGQQQATGGQDGQLALAKLLQLGLAQQSQLVQLLVLVSGGFQAQILVQNLAGQREDLVLALLLLADLEHPAQQLVSLLAREPVACCCC